MFRLRDDARRFFEKIAQGFKVDFDQYYFCAIAGLSNRMRDPEESGRKSRDLVDYFPGPFKAESETLVALLLATELERLKVNRDDKVAVRMVVKELLDPKAPGRMLSAHGMNVMNSYASAGCDLLRQEWFGEAPTSMDSFLVEYHRCLANAER